jgi:HSP20 family molecular chaperone IbpA
MRDDAFVLVPADEFDLDPFNSFGPLGCFGPGGDIPSILAKMAKQLQALDQMRALQRQLAAQQSSISRLTGSDERALGALDFLQNAYELDADGRVHFKVRFDVSGFAPGDIKVTASKNRLTVHAKKVEKSDVSESTSEFCRTLYLPSTVDHDEFHSHLTEDGILTVEAPVKDADYKRITFDKDHQLGIRPQNEEKAPEKAAGKNDMAIVPLKAVGTLGPAVVDNPSGGKKLHVEFPVDPNYDPENLCVRVNGDRIVLTGKHEVTDRTSENESIHIREFTRSYKIPQAVDPLTVKAQMDGDVLVVEAPMIGGETK